MLRLTLDDYKARKKPKRCPGDQPENPDCWDSWGRCKICHASMHCSYCGAECGGQGHLVKPDGEDDFLIWCEYANG